jgi:hypothetical protein
VAHNGSLYCGTGQWCNDGPASGPQIIRLDSEGGGWKLEQAFPIDPVNRIAVACMSEIFFPTANLKTLICGFFGGSAVGLKTASGWAVTPIGDRRGQIRSFAAHMDSVTRVNMAFAGADSGIYSGVYDVILPGQIQWSATPELDISGFPPMFDGHPERVMSMAELRGVLYATVGQRIYRRHDGGHSSWARIWDNPLPGKSKSGIRGLTPIDNDLWFGVEGTQSRIVRFDTTTDTAFTEFDISGPHEIYAIPCYNDIAQVTAADGTPALLIGLDGAETSPAKYISFNKGLWARHDLPALLDHPMVSTRAILTSPFNSGEIYFAGYDCNSKRSRDTAWIVKGASDQVI